MSVRADGAVEHNRQAHDALGPRYDDNHPEIFNPIEQRRLAEAAARAVALAPRREGRRVRALDVGCGTGNVTGHLIAAGATVTAADLSRTFLDVVRGRFPQGDIDGVLELNGRDLRPATDAAFDLVAAYSVLHHVPDYLAMVRDMARVTAPGGIVMIDHERNEESWTSEPYRAFLREAVVRPPRGRWYFLEPARYWRRIRPLFEWRRWGNTRWMPEGDLHVWPDDHIEWSRVEATLAAAGCDMVAREHYLLFEPRFRRDVWDRWSGKVSDMQLLLARKVR